LFQVTVTMTGETQRLVATKPLDQVTVRMSGETQRVLERSRDVGPAGEGSQDTRVIM
jgi:hypothetical protein